MLCRQFELQGHQNRPALNSVRKKKLLHEILDEFSRLADIRVFGDADRRDRVHVLFVWPAAHDCICPQTKRNRICCCLRKWRNAFWRASVRESR